MFGHARALTRGKVSRDGDCNANLGDWIDGHRRRFHRAAIQHRIEVEPRFGSRSACCLQAAEERSQADWKHGP